MATFGSIISDLAIGAGKVIARNVLDTDFEAITPLTTSAFSGLANITVGITAPSSPNTGDLWIDTN
jgi:hypothetical protein